MANQDIIAQLAGMLTPEDLQALTQAMGNQPQPTQTPVPTPVPQPFQQPVYQPTGMRLSDYGSAGAGATTKSLVDAFRACGRAVNGGNDINHSL